MSGPRSDEARGKAPSGGTQKLAFRRFGRLSLARLNDGGYHREARQASGVPPCGSKSGAPSRQAATKEKIQVLLRATQLKRGPNTQATHRPSGESQKYGEASLGVPSRVKSVARNPHTHTSRGCRGGVVGAPSSSRMIPLCLLRSLQPSPRFKHRAVQPGSPACFHPHTNVRCAQGCTATSPPPKIVQWSSTFACVAGCRALTLTRSTAGCGIHWIRLGPLSHPSPLDPARSRRDTKISSQQLVAALPVICIGAIGPAGQCAFGPYRSHPCHIHTNAPGAAFRVG